MVLTAQDKIREVLKSYMNYLFSGDSCSFYIQDQALTIFTKIVGRYCAITFRPRKLKNGKLV